MNIWTKEKASPKETGHGSERVIKDPSDIEEPPQPTNSIYQTMVEEAVANGFRAYTAYIHHQIIEMFENAIKKHVLNRFKKALKEAKTTNDTYPAIVHITTVDLKKMQTDELGFILYVAVLEDVLKNDITIDVDHIGSAECLMILKLSLKNKH